MSAHQITAAAVKHWQDSLTTESYSAYVSACKAKGWFWLAADSL